jgi:hypothetical protein
MKLIIFPAVTAAVIFVLTVILSLTGCKEEPGPTAAATPEQEMKDGHPVVHAAPVETRPFEDGYNAGYDYGKTRATKRSTVPTDDQAAEVARSQAAGQSDRWERGFAQGYTDAVRNIVTGQK